MIINCIVQARMGSKRFPGKVMAEVAGKPLIGHLLDRIKDADVDRIIVAAPENEQGSQLHDYLVRHWVDYIVGPENNVAHRFCNALESFPCDAFIRVCADSPLIDANDVNSVVSDLKSGWNYIHHGCGFPGLQLQGIRTDFFTAYVDDFDEYDREHVLSFFSRHFACVVDTPEDLEKIRPVIEEKIDFKDWVRGCLPK